MALLNILEYPHPTLREKSKDVQQFGKNLQNLLDNMLRTMYEAGGIGLAAPQVGELQRICVIDVSDTRDQPIFLINPQIIGRHGEVSSEEGCLSIPEYRDTIVRDKTIGVKALDQHGKPVEIEAEDLLSRCIQHEIDHLDGVLFIDHLSRLKRELFKDWVKNSRKDK